MKHQVGKNLVNAFDLSHYHSTTMSMGRVNGVMSKMMVPGDTFYLSTHYFTRLEPLLKPILHTINMNIHTYAVPIPLMWKKSEEFFRQEVGLETETIPESLYFLFTLDPAKNANPLYLNYVAGDLGPDVGGLNILGLFLSQLGYETAKYSNYAAQNATLSALERFPVVQQNAFHFLAYLHIWQNYIRDVDVDPDISDELQSITNLTRGGDITNELNLIINKVRSSPLWSNSLFAVNWEKDIFTTARPSIQRGSEVKIPVTNSQLSWHDVIKSLNYNAFLEKALDYPKTWKGYLRMLGMKVSSDIADEPIYLGGKVDPIQITEVVSTAETGSKEVGDYTGNGGGYGSKKGIKYTAIEPSIIMTLAFLRPVHSIMHATDRDFQSWKRIDFHSKQDEMSGFDPMYVKELVGKKQGNSDMDILGYKPSYYWYKEAFNRVSADFQYLSKDWHLARELSQKPGETPVLDKNFIKCIPTERIWTDQTNEATFRHFFVTFKINLIAKRPMSRNNKTLLSL